MDHRSRLVRFYEKYAPQKLNNVDAALDNFAGREDVMWKQLIGKYGPEPPAPSSSGVVPPSATYSSSGAPAADRADPPQADQHVDFAGISPVRGAADGGSSPSPSAAAPEEGASYVGTVPQAQRPAVAPEEIVAAHDPNSWPTDSRSRLIRFYKRYDESKVQFVDSALRDFVGKEDVMWEMLVGMHGPEPERPHVPPGVRPTVDDHHHHQQQQQQQQQESSTAATLQSGSSVSQQPQEQLPWPMDHRSRLVRFYQKYAPEKLEKVDAALANFAGKEDVMWNQLIGKYGPEPEQPAPALSALATSEPEQQQHPSATSPSAISSSPSSPPGNNNNNNGESSWPMDHRSRLVRFYHKYAPEKLKNVDSALVSYRGREDYMFKTLAGKYGTEPEPGDPVVVAALAAAATPLTPALEHPVPVAPPAATPAPAAAAAASPPQPEAAADSSPMAPAAHPPPPVATASAEVPWPMDHRSRLVRFYKKYAPEKLEKVDAALANFAGKEDVMWKQLIGKYGPEPEQPAALASATAPAAPNNTAAASAVPVVVAASETSPATAAVEEQLPWSMDHRSRLVRFYEKYAPEKVEKVDAALANFAGKEDFMWSQLLEKYGPEPQPQQQQHQQPAAVDPASPTAEPSSAPAAQPQSAVSSTTAAAVAPAGPWPMDHRSRLVRFYQRYQPEKVDKVDAALENFAGQEDVMWKTLVDKYGPEPQQPAAAATTTITAPTTNNSDADSSSCWPTDTRSRLDRFYRAYAPDKLDSIDSTMERFSGREDEMWQLLTDKYGPEPARPPPTVAETAAAPTAAADPAAASSTPDSSPANEQVQQPPQQLPDDAIKEPDQQNNTVASDASAPQQQQEQQPVDTINPAEEQNDATTTAAGEPDNAAISAANTTDQQQTAAVTDGGENESNSKPAAAEEEQEEDVETKAKRLKEAEEEEEQRRKSNMLPPPPAIPRALGVDARYYGEYKDILSEDEQYEQSLDRKHRGLINKPPTVEAHQQQSRSSSMAQHFNSNNNPHSKHGSPKQQPQQPDDGALDGGFSWATMPSPARSVAATALLAGDDVEQEEEQTSAAASASAPRGTSSNPNNDVPGPASSAVDGAAGIRRRSPTPARVRNSPVINALNVEQEVKRGGTPTTALLYAEHCAAHPSGYDKVRKARNAAAGRGSSSSIPPRAPSTARSPSPVDKSALIQELSAIDHERYPNVVYALLLQSLGVDPASGTPLPQPAGQQQHHHQQQQQQHHHHHHHQPPRSVSAGMPPLYQVTGSFASDSRATVSPSPVPNMDHYQQQQEQHREPFVSSSVQQPALQPPTIAQMETDVRRAQRRLERAKEREASAAVPKTREQRVAAIKAQLMDDEIKQVLLNFDKYDRNGDGVLDRAEMEVAVRAVLLASGFASSAAVERLTREFIDACDADKDGKLAAGEIRAAFKIDERLSSPTTSKPETVAASAVSNTSSATVVALANSPNKATRPVLPLPLPPPSLFTNQNSTSARKVATSGCAEEETEAATARGQPDGDKNNASVEGETAAAEKTNTSAGTEPDPLATSSESEEERQQAATDKKQEDELAAAQAPAPVTAISASPNRTRSSTPAARTPAEERARLMANLDRAKYPAAAEKLDSLFDALFVLSRSTSSSSGRILAEAAPLAVAQDLFPPPPRTPESEMPTLQQQHHHHAEAAEVNKKVESSMSAGAPSSGTATQAAVGSSNCRSRTPAKTEAEVKEALLCDLDKEKFPVAHELMSDLASDVMKDTSGRRALTPLDVARSRFGQAAAAPEDQRRENDEQEQQQSKKQQPPEPAEKARSSSPPASVDAVPLIGLSCGSMSVKSLPPPPPPQQQEQQQPEQQTQHEEAPLPSVSADAETKSNSSSSTNNDMKAHAIGSSSGPAADPPTPPAAAHSAPESRSLSIESRTTVWGVNTAALRPCAAAGSVPGASSSAAAGSSAAAVESKIFFTPGAFSRGASGAILGQQDAVFADAPTPPPSVGRSRVLTHVPSSPRSNVGSSSSSVTSPVLSNLSSAAPASQLGLAPHQLQQLQSTAFPHQQQHQQQQRPSAFTPVSPTGSGLLLQQGGGAPRGAALHQTGENFDTVSVSSFGAGSHLSAISSMVSPAAGSQVMTSPNTRTWSTRNQ